MEDVPANKRGVLCFELNYIIKMKIKYHILLVLFLMYANAVFAWQPGNTKEHFPGKEKGKTGFNPHWFLSLQGGGAYTLGEVTFGDLISPSVAVALGYKFTPLFGVRTEVSGWQAKGGWVEPMKQNILFALNSARIQDDQQQKISSLVECLEKYPAAKICVTGYADVNTGNAKINFKLSETHAKNVAEALNSKGIAANRIKVDFKGDTVQPYSIPKENRVSICITE